MLSWLAASKAGKLYEDADFDQFLGEGVWDKRKRLATQIFRAWYEGWEDAQINIAVDDRFATALSQSMLGYSFMMSMGLSKALMVW